MNSKIRISMKVREWKEIIRKLNIPDERKKLSQKESDALVTVMQKLEEEVLHLQQKFEYKLKDYVDFRKLRREFFKNLELE